MPLKLTCFACQAVLQVPESLRNQQVRCQKCQQVLTADDTQPINPPTPSAPRESRIAWIVVCLVGLLCLAGATAAIVTLANHKGAHPHDQEGKFVDPTPIPLSLNNNQVFYPSSLRRIGDPIFYGLTRGPYKKFKIRLEKGKSYQFDVQNAPFTAILILQDKDGVNLKSIEGLGFFGLPQITHAPATTDDYYLIVTTRGAMEGSFTITARQRK